MVKSCEAYGRELKTGDYVLTNMDMFSEMQYLLVGKVVDEKMCEYCVDSTFATGWMNPKCYKLEGVGTEILEKYWNEGKPSNEIHQMHAYYKGEFLSSYKQMHDLFGRDVHIGDFVFYTDNHWHLYYGIVIDHLHVFEYPYLIKYAPLVFKVEKPVEKEREIYKKLVANYNNYINSRVQNLAEAESKKSVANVAVGDMFRNGNSVAVYLGRYERSYCRHSHIKQHYNELTYHGFSNMRVFLHLDLELTAWRKAYNALLSGDIDVFEGVITKHASYRGPEHFSGCGDLMEYSYIGKADYTPRDEYLFFNKDVACFRYRKILDEAKE